MIKFVFTLFVASVLLFSNSGTSTSATSCGNKYAIGHINGILTTEQEANYNLNQIQLSYTASGDTRDITYFLAYNQTRSRSSDLDEVTNQKALEFSKEKFEAISLAFIFGDMSLLTSVQLGTTLMQQRMDWILTKGFMPTVAADLVAITDRIATEIASNRSVLIIPHSQGNLFANDAYDSLISYGRATSNKLKIMGIASPASKVSGVPSPGVGDYVTASEDGVILLARLRYAVLFGYPMPVLSSNIDALTLDQLQAGVNDTHGLIPFYLNEEYAALAQIVSNIKTKLDLFASATSGAFSITAASTQSFTLDVSDLYGMVTSSANGVTADICGATPNSFYFLWGNFTGPATANVLLSLNVGGTVTTITILPGNNISPYTGYRYFLGTVYVDSQGKISLVGQQ